MLENRFYERITCSFKFACKHYYDQSGSVVGLEKCAEFDVANLSVGGLMATSTFKVPNEAVLEYTLYLESVPYVILSQVKWCTEIELGKYQYGMAFLTIPNMLYRHLKAFVQNESFYQLPVGECCEGYSPFNES